MNLPSCELPIADSRLPTAEFQETVMNIPSCEGKPCAGQDGLEPVAGSYFVASYPPFSCWAKDRTGNVLKLLQTAKPAMSQVPFGLYVHVPFCVHRCQYCYYFSQADTTAAHMEEYLAALVQELALYRETPYLADRPLGFVYFGGGTPSLLPTASLGRLLARLQERFGWSAAEEVSFECAPKSTTRAKLAVLREAGVNRLSLGVQQLDDRVLKANGRVHLVADVERAWEIIRPVGFDEVNIDLMAGLLGETEESFGDSLERALQMGPDSITIYLLEIPYNTPLYRAWRDGNLPEVLPSWEEKRRRLEYAFARLAEQGYRRRSAYAAARDHRHRRFVYQEDQYRGADLLGIGVSSLSYIGGSHYQNQVAQDSYLAGLRAGRLPLDRAYILSPEEQMVREFVLQLKLGGLDIAYFRHKFQVDVRERFARPLEALAAQGWLTFDPREVRVTSAGLLRVDRLLLAFYLPQHQGLRYS